MSAIRLARPLALCLLTMSMVFAAGCGSSQPVAGGPPPAPPPEPPPPGPISCPDTGDLFNAAEIRPELLPDQDTLRRWQETMVNLGPRITGSPAHKQWHDFMVREFETAGLRVQRDPVPLEWWDHQTYTLTLIENGIETPIRVASYYPYSGFTPEGGVTAELVNNGLGLPQDFLLRNVRGKIAFYEENMLPLTAALFYATASYVHDPDRTLTPLTPYKRASVSFLTPQEMLSLDLAAGAGAVGAIISYEASFENAEGQYTPFLTSPEGSQGVPALYVDRITGNQIKAAIARGASARLELSGVKHVDDVTEDIVATLPGATDEIIIVNTHSDGTSAAQENGTLGVMALARYFAALPQACRQRTMVFTLNPGHFHSGINGDTQRFIENYPDLIGRAVASLTLEHLGQTEWVDDVTAGFHPTGMVEPAAFYGSQNLMQTLMRNAVIAEDLRRVFVARPIAVIYFGVGSPLNARGVPNASYIAGPNMMLAFGQNQHLDKVDYGRMAAEIRTFARVATAMDAADKSILCVGMLPQSTEPTGCSTGSP